MDESLARELALLREFGFTHPDSSGGQAPPPVLALELDALGPEASACVKCRLSKSRTQVVWGVDNPNADLMFIGEAPGRDEDIKGEPSSAARGNC